MATVDTVQSDIAMMIDIETMSLRPDALVTQIGYCVANVKYATYVIQPTSVWLTAVGQESRHVDPDTFRWWMQQDPKVIASVLAAAERTKPDDVFNIFQSIARENPGMTVWGSPAMFDLPVLTGLWGGKKPWRYNYERDMMTLYKLLDPAGEMQPEANSMGHDAAADAQWQMEYLFRLMQELRRLQAGDRP